MLVDWTQVDRRWMVVGPLLFVGVWIVSIHVLSSCDQCHDPSSSPCNATYHTAAEQQYWKAAYQRCLESTTVQPPREDHGYPTHQPTTPGPSTTEFKPRPTLSYKIIKTPVTWEKAVTTCLDDGGRLATIADSEDNDKVLAIIQAFIPTVENKDQPGKEDHETAVTEDHNADGEDSSASRRRRSIIPEQPRARSFGRFRRESEPITLNHGDGDYSDDDTPARSFSVFPRESDPYTPHPYDGDYDGHRIPAWSVGRYHRIPPYIPFHHISDHHDEVPSTPAAPPADRPQDRLWISGYRQKDHFVWASTGEEMGFTYWHAQEPSDQDDERCVAFHVHPGNDHAWGKGHGYRWNNLPCSLHPGYPVCEYVQ